MTSPVPPVVLDFARDLAGVLAELRTDLVGVYLHGSGALGGFVPARSDTGEWYLGRHPEASVVRSALEIQQGATTPPPAAGQTEEFVRKLLSL